MSFIMNKTAVNLCVLCEYMYNINMKVWAQEYMCSKVW